MSLYDLQGLGGAEAADAELMHSGVSVNCDYYCHVDTTCDSGVSWGCDGSW